jgi:hypothetical protein
MAATASRKSSRRSIAIGAALKKVGQLVIGELEHADGSSGLRAG